MDTISIYKNMSAEDVISQCFTDVEIKLLHNELIDVIKQILNHEYSEYDLYSVDILQIRIKVSDKLFTKYYYRVYTIDDDIDLDRKRVLWALRNYFSVEMLKSKHPIDFIYVCCCNNWINKDFINLVYTLCNQDYILLHCASFIDQYHPEYTEYIKSFELINALKE